MKIKNINMEKDNPTLFKWWDATSHSRKGLQMLKNAKDTRDFLSISKTIGYKLAEDKHAILVCCEVCGTEDERDFDILAIPKKWLVE